MSKGHAESEAKAVTVGLGATVSKGKKKKRRGRRACDLQDSYCLASTGWCDIELVAHRASSNPASTWASSASASPPTWRLELQVVVPIPGGVVWLWSGLVWRRFGWRYDRRYRLSGAGSGSRSRSSTSQRRPVLDVADPSHQAGSPPARECVSASAMQCS